MNDVVIWRRSAQTVRPRTIALLLRSGVALPVDAQPLELQLLVEPLGVRVKLDGLEFAVSGVNEETFDSDATGKWAFR